MDHSTIFFLQGALCMCVWASQPACLNWVYQLPLESFEPRYGHICGFVCPLEDLPGGYTCRIWKRLGVIWAGNSGMLQGLGAWSRSKDLGSEWPKLSGPQTPHSTLRKIPARRGDEWVSKSQSGQDRLPRMWGGIDENCSPSVAKLSLSRWLYNHLIYE